MIESATIVQPTSQNQAAIEADLRDLVSANLRLDDDALTSLSERCIRNYDPCISCSTHFLELTVQRRGRRRAPWSSGSATCTAATTASARRSSRRSADCSRPATSWPAPGGGGGARR